MGGLGDCGSLPAGRLAGSVAESVALAGLVWPAALRTGWAAVDCETTGLDPERDALMQLGAVRVTPEGMDGWSALVDPGRPVPLHVQRLTGIGPSRLATAGSAAAALESLKAFVGALPLFAHHAAFDGAFLRAALRAHGLSPLPSPVYDTLELARLADPLAPSHRLGDLSERYGLVLDQAHDALHDACATAALVAVLVRRLAAMEPALRGTLTHLLLPVGGDQAALIRALLGAAPRAVIVCRPAPSPAPGFGTVARSGPVSACGVGSAAGSGVGSASGSGVGSASGPGVGATSDQGGAPGPLATPAWAGLERLLSPGSPLARSLGGVFEVRPAQVRMLAAVARALESDRHLVVEAGTGTGKSLAYLLPALARAAASGSRVVVATHTLQLQDQLVEKDLPLIAASGVLPVPVAVLKGRAQYVCLKLWEEQLAAEATPADGPFLARVAAWLAETETGDRAELNLHGEEDERFAALSAEAVACTGRRCPLFDPCFLFRARRRAEAAGVVVVNHALLFSDLQAERGVLPEHAYVVCDEAHHMEDEASNHLGRTVSERALEHFFRMLERAPGGARSARPPDGGGATPLIGAWASAAPQARRVRAGGILPTLRVRYDPLGLLPGADGQRAARTSRRLAEALAALDLAREGAAAGCDALRAWTCAREPAGQTDRWTVRLPATPEGTAPDTAPLRGPLSAPSGLAVAPGGPAAAVPLGDSVGRPAPGGPAWTAVGVEGERLCAGLRRLAEALEAVAATLDDESADAGPDAERIAELRALAGRAAELAADLTLCLHGREGWVTWIEVARSRSGSPGAVVLRACPVDPADLLRQGLFTPQRAVVLTSATLAVRGACGFLRERVGLAVGDQAERTDELLVGSPFDYRRQALLAVPTDLSRLESGRALASARDAAPWLLALLRATRGHALLLFTAHRLLREVRAALRPALEADGIACLAQGVDGARGALAAALRRNEETVVLGAASFWEGVDIQGAGLRLVIIAQLPFWPPDMPLQAARQEALRARGLHPFAALQLPQAVLRFKQGFGRLIRSASDRGAVVCLDPRLISAPYGRVFLESLPDPELLVAPRAEVLARVRAACAPEMATGAGASS